MPPKFPTLLISTISKTEDDNYYMEFDMSDEFVAWFKKEQSLKRWSNKRFEKWVTENIDAIVEQQPTPTGGNQI
jgi:hypothetical protein